MVGRGQDDQSAWSWPRLLWVAAIVALLAAFAGAVRTLATVGGGPNWGMIGNDSTNSRNQPFEHSIGPANAGSLGLKWVATTAGDVSATPAVVNGAVYFGDFGGMLWKLDADTGQVIWSHVVSDYTGIAGDIARTSPSVAGNTLVVGDLKHPIRKIRDSDHPLRNESGGSKSRLAGAGGDIENVRIVL